MLTPCDDPATVEGTQELLDGLVATHRAGIDVGTKLV
jgi:hypothetical protein